MAIEGRITVENLDESRKVLRQTAGKDGQKALGRVHKRIGEMVIRQAGGKQTGVGSGAGSTMRPSSAARQVTIRVGGKHREGEREQWGREQTWPPPERPFIIEAASQISDRIEREYRDGLMEELSRLP